MNFLTSVTLGLPGGVAFRLADGTNMSTSVREAGGRVTAPVVRSALEIAEKDFKRRGLVGGTESLARIQQFIIFQAEVIQYMATVTPGSSMPGFTIEQSAAVVALQTSLKLLEQPNDK